MIFNRSPSGKSLTQTEQTNLQFNCLLNSIKLNLEERSKIR